MGISKYELDEERVPFLNHQSSVCRNGNLDTEDQCSPIGVGPTSTAFFSTSNFSIRSGCSEWDMVGKVK